MNTFGTGGLFACFVIAAVFGIFEYGWQGIFTLVALVCGWIWFVGLLNRTFHADGTLRRRRGGRGRHY